MRRAASALCGLPADALLRSVAAREQSLWGRVYEVELQPDHQLKLVTRADACEEQAALSSSPLGDPSSSNQLLLNQ